MRSTMDEIKHVLVHHCGIAESRVTSGTRINEFGFDSLDRADFLFDLETECVVDIDLDQNPIFENVGTLGELAAAIDKCKALRAA